MVNWVWEWTFLFFFKETWPEGQFYCKMKQQLQRVARTDKLIEFNEYKYHALIASKKKNHPFNGDEDGKEKVVTFSLSYFYTLFGDWIKKKIIPFLKITISQTPFWWVLKLDWERIKKQREGEKKNSKDIEWGTD